TLRQQYITQGVIRSIKNNLKIDLDNPKHIIFWQDSRKNIPNHIAQLMQVANQEYATTEDFIVALDKMRKKSCCNRFFTFIFIDKRRSRLTNPNSNLRTLVIH